MTDDELLKMVRTAPVHGKASQRNKTKKMRQYLLSLPGRKRCFYCRCFLTRETATVEHLKPICKGGKTTRENCVLACQPCNEKEGSLIINDLDNGIKGESSNAST